MKKIINLLSLGLLFCLAASFVFAQGKLYEGPDDPAGDISAERYGHMTGNRISLYFENNTQLANYTGQNSPDSDSKWPNDYSGSRMLDLITVLVAGEVYLQTGPVRRVFYFRYRGGSFLYLLQPHPARPPGVCGTAGRTAN